MGDKQRTEEDQLSGYGGVSWQDMGPSPGIPIWFPEQNAALQPRSPLYFSEYLDGKAATYLKLVYPIYSFDKMISNLMFYFYFYFGTTSLPVMPPPSLPQQGDQLPKQSYVWQGPSSSNQLLDTLSSSQNPSLRFNQPQNHHTEEKPLSKDQKYRQRLKAKQKVKDDHVEMLEHQSLMKDKEIALLKSEIKNKNEEITLLQSMVEMLREENASINYDNLPIH
ncbi:hypothetical protein GQ457_14G005830 [Hibiscus cannabinus]